MALIGKHNIAKMRSTTVGTGTLTLTTAMTGYLTFALAGVVNGERVTYTIRDGSNTEVGEGIYTSSGTTLTRATILSSTNAGAAISCTGNQVVFITLAAEDITPFASYYSTTPTVTANGVNDATLTLGTETVDHMGLASLSSNTIVVAKKGWYVLAGNAYFSAASAFNGRAKLSIAGYIQQPGYTTAMNILEDSIYIGPIMYNVASDAGVIGPFLISNNTGFSITTYLEVNLWQVGKI